MAADAGSLSLPSKLFTNTTSFGIDFGSSLLKLVYSEFDGEEVTVHLENYAKKDFDKMVDFIKTRSPPLDGLCHVTGAGVGVNVPQLETQLGVKCEVGSEEVYMMDAFTLLARALPWHQFVYPPDVDLKRQAAQTTKQLCDQVWPAMLPPERCEARVWKGGPDNLVETTAIHFPTILSLVGSGHYIDKLEESGRYSCLDFYTIAGRTFLGLGKLLTHAGNFSELVAMASEGEPKLNQDMPAVSGVMECAFGPQPSDVEAVTKETVCSSLVAMLANTVAQDAYNWSVIEGITQVFFIGGVLANDEYFRRQVEREFYLKSYSGEGDVVRECYFVRCGGHLPALGALLLNMGLVQPT